MTKSRSKVTVTRTGAVLTATDGKTSRTVEYKHTRAAALVAERLTVDKSFAAQWLRDGAKPQPTQTEMFECPG
jgi:hypothetical protein